MEPFHHAHTCCTQGILPISFALDAFTQRATGDYTVGAMADSYYEYLLKMWIMEGCSEEVLGCIIVYCMMTRAAGKCVAHGMGAGD